MATEKKNLTPMDIHNKEFKHRGRSGYDSYEVDKFLDEIIDDYGDVLDQVIDLKNQVAGLEEQVAQAEETNQYLNNQIKQYQDREHEVNEVLLSAQKSASQIKQDAEQQAQEILNSANNSLKQEKDNYASLDNEYQQLLQKVSADRQRIQDLLQREIDNLNDENWHHVLSQHFDQSNSLNDVNNSEDVDKDYQNSIESTQAPVETDEIITGDSPKNQTVDTSAPVENTQDAGATIVFPDNYKDHN